LGGYKSAHPARDFSRRLFLRGIRCPEARRRHSP